jgi:chemotaxis protein MotA
MAVVGGGIFILVMVLTGFTMAGGHVGALLHPSEVVTIGGASLGALIIMSTKKVLFDLLRSVMEVLKGTPYNKPTFLELLSLLNALARMARREGLMALEGHITKGHDSPLFQKYPRIHKNHHALDFLCTALAMIVDNQTSAEKLSSALEEEVKVIAREHHAAVAVLSKTADALPGFGIVAAVLGIVVTMQAIDGPASEIGHKVGAALVGTFLGILASYGLFAPMAARMELLGEIELNFYRAIVAAVIAIAAAESPREVINCARRMAGTDCRPSIDEMTKIAKET